jgi:hypothetical protein
VCNRRTGPLAEYDDFGRTGGLAIDGHDTIYTADSESTERSHPGWLKGIRIGSLKDGKVTMFILPTRQMLRTARWEKALPSTPPAIYIRREATLRGVTKFVKN